MKKIEAKIVADSKNEQGDRITTYLLTYPRFIHSELMTHRVFSRNSASSRAIPFEKMVKMVEEDPFIPLVWQKDHKGMQGNEYLTDKMDVQRAEHRWLIARTNAIEQAKVLSEGVGVTKQLCNRILEPFMWHTVLLTATEFSNFFKLRCPQYNYLFDFYKSKKDVLKASKDGKYNDGRNFSDFTTEDWLGINRSQAEIHIQAIAEMMYDAMNESIPKTLQSGEWHIPFEGNIHIDGIQGIQFTLKDGSTEYHEAKWITEAKVKISVAMAAHTSYTTVGNEPVKSYEKWIELHDKLIAYDPPHSSPMEHCARAMSDDEYECFLKGEREIYKNANHWSDVEYFYDYDKIFGWCNNLKGFIPYRYMIDNNLIK